MKLDLGKVRDQHGIISLAVSRTDWCLPRFVLSLLPYLPITDFPLVKLHPTLPHLTPPKAGTLLPASSSEQSWKTKQRSTFTDLLSQPFSWTPAPPHGSYNKTGKHFQTKNYKKQPINYTLKTWNSFTSKGQFQGTTEKEAQTCNWSLAFLWPEALVLRFHCSNTGPSSHGQKCQIIRKIQVNINYSIYTTWQQETAHHHLFSGGWLVNH